MKQDYYLKPGKTYHVEYDLIYNGEGFISPVNTKRSM